MKNKKKFGFKIQKEPNSINIQLFQIFKSALIAMDNLK